jgi:hypothetical protein
MKGSHFGALGVGVLIGLLIYYFNPGDIVSKLTSWLP